MKVGFLHIGDELLTGDIIPYSEEMIRASRSKGAVVSLIAVVGDNLEDIVRALEFAESNQTDILIVTGGLGPTLDDITKEAVGLYLGVEVGVSSQAQEWLEESLTRMHGRRPKLTEERLRMALLPEGTVPLRNLTGAACGVEAKKGGMTFFLLPGFPNEMIPMFHQYILPKISGGNFELELRSMLGESVMDPSFRLVAKEYGVRISSIPDLNWREKGTRIVVKGDKERVEEASERLRQLISDLERSNSQ